MTGRTARSREGLSLTQARGVTLAAQGFLDRPPSSTPTARHRRRVLERVGLIQIDSVNVLARAHYLPMFSRLGPYDVSLLDRAAYRDPRELFEYWGHEASLIPVALQPALRWRMRDAGLTAWAGIRTMAHDHPDLVRAVVDVVRAEGPKSAREIEHAHHGHRQRERSGWWDWSHVKRAVEFAFWSGQVTTAYRRGFERVYDLPERVLPAAVLNAPDLSDSHAHQVLVERAARSLGVGTAIDLRDYFRMSATETEAAIDTLVDDGVLLPVAVEGWGAAAYLHRDARVPRAASVQVSALVSPFDPVVWNRKRTERLFGMTYRIEIYVPEAQRVHGYYVLPFLLGDTLVARVDLKADRTKSVLRVKAAHTEPEAPGDTAVELASQLKAMGCWLGLDDIVVESRGSGAGPLRQALVAAGR